MSEGQHILLIEDDRRIREFVTSALEAGTANWGMSEAARLKPDLLMLDLGLPDGDGVEFIRDYRGFQP